MVTRMADLFENKCDVVRDLLPLYADHLASAETNALIISHIAKCKNCGDFLRYIISCKEKAREERRQAVSPDYRAFIHKLKRERRVERAIFACSLMISAAAVTAGIIALGSDNERSV